MKTDNHAHGFTLIELLAVMAIMLVLGGVAVSQYFELRRGAAMRASVRHVRSSVMLAKQMAVSQNKAMMVVFDTSGTAHSFVVVVEHGEGESLGPNALADEFADWSNLGPGAEVYNLDRGLGSTVTKVERSQNGNWTLTTADSIWGSGLNAYGWVAYPRSELPLGFTFKTAGIAPSISDPLIFNPDGTMSGARQDYIIGIVEAINPTHYMQMKVKFPTGFVSTDFK